jgi:hypothetical protein
LIPLARPFRRPRLGGSSGLEGLRASPIVGTSHDSSANSPVDGPFSRKRPNQGNRRKNLPLFCYRKLAPKTQGGSVADHGSLEFITSALRSGQSLQPVAPTPLALLHPSFNRARNAGPIIQKVTFDLLRSIVSRHSATVLKSREIAQSDLLNRRRVDADAARRAAGIDRKGKSQDVNSLVGTP